MKRKLKSMLEILLIIIFFILVSYLVQTNIEFFRNLIGQNFLGMLIYVLIAIVAIVIAPISTIPLLPIASNLWGVFIATILNFIGWFIGAIIAFILARKYGIKIIKNFISLEKINKFANRIPKENLFWSLVLLRILIPVDVLSYALGFFSKIKLRTYALATFIGIIPFAIVYAYLGKLSFFYQILILPGLLMVLLLSWLIKEKNHS
jgi:uncharacterized membrane protein YdjX (TVP38/TMEM64 family)